jgi:hypothetical protein
MALKERSSDMAQRIEEQKSYEDQQEYAAFLSECCRGAPLAELKGSRRRCPPATLSVAEQKGSFGGSTGMISLRGV